MNRFAQWINDWRWAANVRRARAFRRDLKFSQRVTFDAELRPVLASEGQGVVAYPDAFYYVEIDDLVRAMMLSSVKR